MLGLYIRIVSLSCVVSKRGLDYYVLALVWSLGIIACPIMYLISTRSNNVPIHVDGIIIL